MAHDAAKVKPKALQRPAPVSASDDERVIGILTTGWKPIFPQCDNNLQKHRESGSSTLTASEFYAETKDIKPANAANCGPIIRKPFWDGKCGV
ncbi:hypothetical protein [Pseudomonas orientalis]|uniref:hypothetical protein n=1 Tax=Pseudomonas orientalis TaxID=76758 RepID=UPI0015E7D88E|nr:hypothetical protein [Pseudomonas orientalis]MBA1430747.1 hypothetical protein [Pseudomonas orientalis]